MLNYRLNLIRHGYTAGNMEGRYIGRTDLPLTVDARKTLTELVEKDSYPDVQKVYTSPLLRCMETTEIIYPEKFIKIIPKMTECDFGDFEGKTPDELALLPEYEAWLKGGYGARPPKGESYEEFTLRCLEGLEEIFKDMTSNQIQNASLITHSGVIMNLLAGYGLPKGRPADFTTKQGEGFEIILTSFLWGKGPLFEIAGRLF